MAVNALFQRLVDVYRDTDLRYPQLRAATLAQWLVASDRGSSALARDHYNFAALAWRPEMRLYATPVTDGAARYCKFATLESFISGYWAFLNRAPYSGWESHVADGEDFLNFIGPIYAADAGYAARVLRVLPEAAALLEASPSGPAQPATGTDLGTVVIDPGHGGTVNMPGSSANNAISRSGVKEKKLALDFCLILRDELNRQAARAGERIKVVLTRTGDVNLAGSARAGVAFANQAKLFFSLHFNGSANPSARGPETFYRAAADGNLNLTADIAFAAKLHEGLLAGLKAVDPSVRDRGVKPDTDTGPGALGTLNDRALGNDRRDKMCSSAYVEVEFITNPTVERVLVSGPDSIANRTTVMGSMAKAIREHLRTMS